MTRSTAPVEGGAGSDDRDVDRDLAGQSGPSCPFCDQARTALVSPFGCQHMTAQYRCSACGSYFEAVRDDR